MVHLRPNAHLSAGSRQVTPGRAEHGQRRAERSARLASRRIRDFSVLLAAWRGERERTNAHAFGTMGAQGFAERARRELLATGETVRRRTADARDSLTPQEAQIARLAARGQSNSDIATQLYLSHRTVEWHLHKVFAKLGISRKGLAKALPASRSELVPV